MPTELPVPIFVSRQKLAALLDVSVETITAWRREGLIPPPAIQRGQIMRWHWPTIEARFATTDEDKADDPYMTGVNRAPRAAR